MAASRPAINMAIDADQVEPTVVVEVYECVSPFDPGKGRQYRNNGGWDFTDVSAESGLLFARDW